MVISRVTPNGLHVATIEKIGDVGAGGIKPEAMVTGKKRRRAPFS
jgi:hypothetical protein